MTLAMAGVWAFYLFREGKVNWNVLAPAGVFAVFLALASGLQVWPAYQYGHLARRWAGAPAPIGWTKLCLTRCTETTAWVFRHCLG